ncbi:MAG: T9SS type A sorting domain-containing protein [Flavobacterium sp.]|nr:T9SS type A sorting domain-containing protein [Flavobacterium sp.]
MSSFNFISAQILQSEDFNALNVGNIGTDFTGVTAGQGGWFTAASNGTAPTTSNNAGNTNFQIVSSGNISSNGLLLNGPNGDKGNRFMWKDGLGASWASRTSGNNIIELEVDINPGTRGTSVNRLGLRIYDPTGARTLAGFQVNSATGEIFLVAYSTPSGNPVGNYSYSLAAAPGIQLPENTWSRVGVSYNKTTGVVLIKGPGIPANTGVNSSSINTDPDEVDFVVVSGNTATVPNTVSGSMTFDNLIVKASNTDTLLTNQLFNSTNISYVIHPNPVVDFIEISNLTAEVKKITISDINGRIVKVCSSDEVLNLRLNLQDLNSGVYLMVIDTNEGVTSQKIIKN